MSKRLKGEGTIRQHGSRWQASIQIGGRRRWKTFAKEADARAWLIVVQADSVRGVLGALAPSGPAITFAEAARRYVIERTDGLADRPWRAGTVAFYRQRLVTDLLPAFGRRKLDTITAEEIEGWLLAQLGRRHRRHPAKSADAPRSRRPIRTVCRSSVAKLRQILHSVFAWAVRVGRLVVSPMARVRRITAEPKDQRCLDLEEIRAMLRCAGYLRPMITILALTGLRRSELMRLRWEWIDWGRKILHVREAKRGSSSLPLAPVVEQTLKALGVLPEGLVFPGRDGQRAGVDAALARVAVRAGVPGATMHAFRRAFVTLLDGLPGGSYGIVRSLARHSMRSSSDVTARYLYHDHARLLAALTQLERLVIEELPALRIVSGGAVACH